MEIIKNNDLDFSFTAEKRLEDIGLELSDLDLLGQSRDEIINNIKGNFDFVKPENSMTVERYLTDDEISEARENVLDIVENKLPEFEAKLEEAKAEASRLVNDAKGMLNSYIAQYKDIAKYVKLGVDDVKIDAKDIFRIAYNGYFVYLLVLESGLKVVKIIQIPENELEKWPNQLDQDRANLFFGKLKDVR